MYRALTVTDRARAPVLAAQTIVSAVRTWLRLSYRKLLVTTTPPTLLLLVLIKKKCCMYTWYPLVYTRINLSLGLARTTYLSFSRPPQNYEQSRYSRTNLSLGLAKTKYIFYFQHIPTKLRTTPLSSILFNSMVLTVFPKSVDCAATLYFMLLSLLY